MAFVRISIMHPASHEREHLEAVIDDLLRIDTTLPGFLSGSRLIPQDGTGEIWRVTHWESEQAADHAAQNQAVLARRAEVIRLIGDERHEERGFFTV